MIAWRQNGFMPACRCTGHGDHWKYRVKMPPAQQDALRADDGANGKPPSCGHWLRLDTLSNRSRFLYPQQCSLHDLSWVHACRLGFQDSENPEWCERNLPSPRLLYTPSCK